ncbi:VIT family protein [uncultured archaeon]|nr:VIT family protein [uncultured archaeon]
MKKSWYKKKEMLEKHNRSSALFKDFILGGQDGLVNVLGIILGLSVGTGNPKIVILAGLAATFTEAVSMGAVSYTSTKAESDFYKSQEKQEEFEIGTCPDIERKEIYDIYYKKGFRGKLLNDVVKNITSNKKKWKDTMMKEELGLNRGSNNPFKNAIVVFLAAIIGSFIPLLPFFFFQISNAIIFSLIISAVALFITGAVEAKLTIGNWIKKGIQLTVIGMVAALIGFIVGKLTGYNG